MFLDESDGLLGESGVNNFYLYRPPGTSLHTFIPWDKSEAMHTGPRRSVMHNIDNVPEAARNRLAWRALKWDDLRMLYYDTLVACAIAADELIPGDGRGWLLREVDQELSQTQTAALEDAEKPFSNDDYIVAVEALRTFAFERAAFVLEEVAYLKSLMEPEPNLPEPSARTAR